MANNINNNIPKNTAATNLISAQLQKLVNQIAGQSAVARETSTVTGLANAKSAPASGVTTLLVGDTRFQIPVDIIDFRLQASVYRAPTTNNNTRMVPNIPTLTANQINNIGRFQVNTTNVEVLNILREVAREFGLKFSDVQASHGILNSGVGDNGYEGAPDPTILRATSVFMNRVQERGLGAQIKGTTGFSVQTNGGAASQWIQVGGYINNAQAARAGMVDYSAAGIGRPPINTSTPVVPVQLTAPGLMQRIEEASSNASTFGRNATAFARSGRGMTERGLEAEGEAQTALRELETAIQIFRDNSHLVSLESPAMQERIKISLERSIDELARQRSLEAERVEIRSAALRSEQAIRPPNRLADADGTPPQGQIQLGPSFAINQFPANLQNMLRSFDTNRFANTGTEGRLTMNELSTGLARQYAQLSASAPNATPVEFFDSISSILPIVNARITTDFRMNDIDIGSLIGMGAYATNMPIGTYRSAEMILKQLPASLSLNPNEINNIGRFQANTSNPEVLNIMRAVADQYGLKFSTAANGHGIINSGVRDNGYEGAPDPMILAASLNFLTRVETAGLNNQLGGTTGFNVQGTRGFVPLRNNPIQTYTDTQNQVYIPNPNYEEIFGTIYSDRTQTLGESLNQHLDSYNRILRLRKEASRG